MQWQTSLGTSYGGITQNAHYNDPGHNSESIQRHIEAYTKQTKKKGYPYHEMLLLLQSKRQITCVL